MTLYPTQRLLMGGITPGRTRTCINSIRSRVHYPLCYGGGGALGRPAALKVLEQRPQTGSSPLTAGRPFLGRAVEGPQVSIWIALTRNTLDTITRKVDLTTPRVAARPTPSVPPWAVMPA